MELLNRRSKPPFPMTYTARATLEIGSSSVSSGRAVTTTTASNQVRTPPPPRLRTPSCRLGRHKKQPPNLCFVMPDADSFRTPPTSGPPERLFAKTRRLYIQKGGNIVLNSKQFYNPKDRINNPKMIVYKKLNAASICKHNSQYLKIKDTLRSKPEVRKIKQSNELSVVNEDKTDPIQLKLLSALLPRKSYDVDSNNSGGNKPADMKESEFSIGDTSKGRKSVPHGPEQITKDMSEKTHRFQKTSANLVAPRAEPIQQNVNYNSQSWLNKVNSWYEGLGTYSNSYKSPENAFYQALHSINNSSPVNNYGQTADFQNRNYFEERPKNTNRNIHQKKDCGSSDYFTTATSSAKSVKYMKPKSMQALTDKGPRNETRYEEFDDEPNRQDIRNVHGCLIDIVFRGNTHTNELLRYSTEEYKNRIGKGLHPPSLCSINPRNIRSMSIGKPTVDVKDNFSIQCAYTLVNEHIADKTNQDNKYVHKTGDIVTIDKYISTESVNLRSHINNEFLSCNNQQKCDNIARTGHFETDILNHSVRSNTPIHVEQDSTQETEFIETELKTNSCTNEKEVDIFGKGLHGVRDRISINSLKETELVRIATKILLEENNKDIKLEHHISHNQQKQSFKLEEDVELRDMNSDLRQKNNSFGLYLKDQKKLFHALKAMNEEVSVQDSFFVRRLDNIAEELPKACEIMEQIECSNNNLVYKNELLYALEANYVEGSVQDNLSINNLDISSEKVQIYNNITKQVDCCSKFIEEECIKTPNIYIESEFSDNRNPISATTSECSNKVLVHNNTVGETTESITSDGKSASATVQCLNELTRNNDPVRATIEALNETVKKKMEPLVSDEYSISANDCQKLVVRNKTVDENEPSAQGDLQELPDNAFVSLTFLKRFPAPSVDETDNIIHVETATKPKKKIEKVSDSSGIKKYMINKDALRTLLLQNLFKSDDSEQSVKLGEPAITDNEVDTAIPFNCITSSEIVDSCNTTPSTTQSAVTEDTKSRSVISSSFNGLPIARTSYGSTASSAPDDFKKSLDENGNSLQGISSPPSSQHKKPRRKKSSKNETVITSHQIDGYQGNKDLNEVLRFIESNADHGRGPKLGRAKHKDDSEDKSGKKRSTERRKDKETKLKRATSMEELSRTKLEDLTDKPSKKERWPEGGAAGKAERRSWGDDSRGAYYYGGPAAPAAPEPADTDFQTVTKKRKPRRRADEGEREPEPGAGDPPRAARAPSPRARRVSAPPSDRSNDSNDDMDSVHSLPADGPPARPAPPAAPVSYADIARTRHNIPDLIESCNFYAEGEVGAGGGGGGGLEAARRALEATPAAPGDVDGYPALEPRAAAARRARDRDRDVKPAAPPAPVRRDRKERPAEPSAVPAQAQAPPDCPAPDVVADRRPPVILLDSAARPLEMDGITFGFDINEQLLSGPARRPRCDLIRDAVEGAEASATTVIGSGGAVEEGGVAVGVDVGVGVGVAVLAGCAALRFVPPAPPPDTHHLLQIVDYVGAAWEDVVRCGSGKVRYFSE